MEEAKADQISELENQSALLQEQAKIIDQLDKKLRVVSNSSPQDSRTDNATLSSGVHLSNNNYTIRENNKQLYQIIESLVI